MENIEMLVDVIIRALDNSRYVWICGNGGSASQAEHFVAELQKNFLKDKKIDEAIAKKIDSISEGVTGKFSDKLKKGYPIISLTNNISTITAIANDISFDLIYAQQLLNQGKKGDVVILLSTSSTSKNIVNTAVIAKAIGIKSIIITGRECKNEQLFDLVCKVNKDKTADIQEAHLKLIHEICEKIENIL